MNELATKNIMEEDDEIDLFDLFLYLRQRLRYFIIAFVLGAVLAVVGSYLFITPTYDASSEIYIVSASNDSVVNLSDLQVGASLTADYEDLLTSRPMMESVLQSLELDYTVDELRGIIQIENPDDTRILKITVTTENPEMSARIANKMSELAIDWLPSVMECEAPNLVEEAIPATEKAGPSLKKAAVLGAVGAVVLVAIVFCVRYLLNDTVRSAEDMERYFGMTPLASIPEDNSDPKLHIKKNRKKAGRKPPVRETVRKEAKQ